MERFNLKKLNDVAVKEQHEIKVSIGMWFWKTLMMMWTSVGLEKRIKENMKDSDTKSVGYCELKQQ